MSGALRSAASLALGALTVLACACDELGNPVSDRAGTTPPLAWSSPIVTLETESRSVAAESADTLITNVPEAQLFHVQHPRPGEVATLVTVRPHWHRPIAPAQVSLVTELRLSNGSVVQARWVADTTAPVWYAVFAPPVAPVAAATAVGR